MTASRIAVATGNSGKLREWSQLLAEAPLPPVDIVSIRDFPQLQQAAETGSTLSENARIKAEHLAGVAGCITLGDDTGLEVDALAGAPGVKSARFGGPDATDDDNIDLLLERLADVPPPRTARFRCVIALIDPQGDRRRLVSGSCEGEIITERRGSGGFGYDPVFYVPQLERTFGELTPTEKSAVGHRGRAAEKAAAVLAGWL